VVESTSSASNMHEIRNENSNHYRNTVIDAMRMSEGNVRECPIVEEEPNADAARFFDLLKDSDEPLWDSCMNHIKLSAVAQVFTIKSDHGLSEAGYDKIIEWARSILPEGNRLKENFYVCLRPLIDELTQLWSSRALTYDILRKQNFVMRAALMWTINDFPTYGMVSGWSTHEKLACPYCMENNKASTLTNGGKASFFFTVTVISCRRITGIERTQMISLLEELKRMLHPRVFPVKNCLMLCKST